MAHRVTQKERTQRAFRAYLDLIDTADWLKREMRVPLESFDMTMQDFRLLEMLYREGALTMPDVARKLGRVRQDVHVIVARLQERGWVGRMMVALPADSDDPLERVRFCHENAVSAKESHQLMGPELIARWAAYWPPAGTEAVFRWLSNRDGQNKILNLNISNVPGPRERGRVGGALVTEIYSVGPLTAGSGLNITVWSYVDQLNISVLSDGATVKDPHDVTEAMIADFIEIRRAARLSESLTVVQEAMAQA